MYCPSCGALNDDNVFRCVKCQTVIQPSVYPPSSGGLDDPNMRFILPVRTTTLSIIAGYLGLLSLIPIFAPLAIIVGIFAIRDLKSRPHLYGMGRAVFGLVMGIVSILFWIIVLVYVFMNGQT